MKNTVVITIGLVLCVAMIIGNASYVSYVNRNKEHVYSAEELFAIECGKRGGNPSTETGSDFSGEKNVQIQQYKCEGATDVHN